MSKSNIVSALMELTLEGRQTSILKIQINIKLHLFLSTNAHGSMKVYNREI